MSEPQPIRFSVPEAGFDLTLLPEAARLQGSQVFRDAVTTYYKDAYCEAGGRVDVGFSEGQIEVIWEPEAGQVPASATITAHLEAGRYDEADRLLRNTWPSLPGGSQAQEDKVQRVARRYLR